MFRKSTPEDVTQFELENYVNPHFDSVSGYFKKIVIPEACAFVIYSAYKNHLEENSFFVFINDGLTNFNFEYSEDEMNELKEPVSEILKARYGLAVVNDDPLQLKECFNEITEV